MLRNTNERTTFERETPEAKYELFTTPTKILEIFKLQVTLMFGMKPHLGSMVKRAKCFVRANLVFDLQS